MTIYIKVCSSCKISKPIADFSKKKDSRDGHQGVCKQCNKKYREGNKEAIDARNKKWRADNVEARKASSKKWRTDNKDSFDAKNKKWRNDNPDYMKKWHDDNPGYQREYNKQYAKSRRRTDPLFKLTRNIRSLISTSMRKGGFKKTSKTAQILGCSFEEFKAHIEKQFTEGMSWDNYGAWEYDHITPSSWALTEEEAIALNHHINIKPMWALDNQKKSNRFSDHK